MVVVGDGGEVVLLRLEVRRLFVLEEDDGVVVAVVSIPSESCPSTTGIDTMGGRPASTVILVTSRVVAYTSFESGSFTPGETMEREGTFVIK